MACTSASTSKVKNTSQDVRKMFLKSIVKNNPLNYPKTSNDLCKLLLAFLENGTETIKKYPHFSIANSKYGKILVVKTPDPSKFKKIIILQDAYNIINNAHLALGHSSKLETIDYVNKDYLIPYGWVDLVIDKCDLCSKANNDQASSCVDVHTVQCGLKPDLLVTEVSICSINISDSGFHNVIIYVDQTTHYVVVRPLRTDAAEEIALELLKLFADFKVPDKMGIPKSTPTIFNKAIEILRNVNLPFKLPITVCNDYSYVLSLCMTKILQQLWSTLSDFERDCWAISIGLLQWKMNLKVNGEITSRFVPKSAIKSQYHAHFGSQLRDTCFIPPSENHEVCWECKYPVYKVYKCYICIKQPLHFTCCERMIIKKNMVSRVLYSCFSCVKSINDCK